MFVSFKYGIKREGLLALRGRGQWLNPLIFFIMVSSLFPLSSMDSPEHYQKCAPSIIWIGFLLASILSLEFSFRADFEEGVFEQWVLSPVPLWFLLFTKGLAHWLINLLPMVILAPIIGYSLHLSSESLLTLVFSLLLGTPILSMIALIGVCLTLGIKNSGLLLSLILLPLTIPVLIFGVSAVHAYEPNAQLALLGAMLVMSCSFGPMVAAFALKISL